MVTSLLDRKLLRELAHSKGQSLAIAVVVASGVAVFVMALGVLSFLQSTRDAYYDRYRFADLFAALVRSPEPVVNSLQAIDGIARVQTRLVTDVTLDVPRLLEPAVGRLISLPAEDAPTLNAVHLVAGRWPQPQRFGEVIAAEAFTKANKLGLGDEVSAIINGRYQPLRIVGVGLSPEYVFQIRGGDLLPDDRRFGVFWMPREGLEAAMDMDGAFNDVSLKLLRGAAVEDVKEQVDRILAPYGGIGAYGRDEQISARFLDDEIRQLRATGLIAPAIFLGVAAFLLNIVISRRIYGDRESIAMMRAFGYRGGEIAWHYLKTALLIALVGTIAGALLGHWMGLGLAKVYAEFYRFPTFAYHPDVRVFIPAIGLSVLAAVLGTLRSTWTVISLQPAEAMRPPAPPRFGPTLLEQLGFGLLLPLMGRMILRQLARRGISAFLAALGIAASVAVMLLSGFAPDALDYLIDFQFSQAQRHDVQVVLKDIHSPDAVYDLSKLSGVQMIEPFRAVPVRLRFRHRDHKTSILGLGDDRDLYRLLNVQEQPIRLPPDGLVLSDRLAALLDVKAGEIVEVDVLEGAKPQLQIEVAGIVSELAGTNAYMRLSPLHQRMREADVINGAFLAVDDRFLPEMYHQLKETPAVASVSVKESTVRQFQETVSQNTLKMQSFTIFFAAVIAVGVVYNTARISLDERARELATMRVIGFTRGEVSFLLLGELMVLTLLAIPLGWAIGTGFCWAMVEAFKTDNFRIPFVISRSNLATSALTTLVATIISGLLVRRRLDSLDLVEVLKSR